MSSALTSDRTAFEGRTKKKRAAPPAIGSKYVPQVGGSNDASLGAIICLPPAHLRAGRRGSSGAISLLICLILRDLTIEYAGQYISVLAPPINGANVPLFRAPVKPPS